MLSQVTNTATKFAVKNAPIVGKYALQVGVSTAKTAIGVATTLWAVGAGICIAEKVKNKASKLSELFEEKRRNRELEELKSFTASGTDTVISETISEDTVKESKFNVADVKSIFAKLTKLHQLN
jgi:adenylosuccinate synthase